MVSLIPLKLQQKIKTMFRTILYAFAALALLNLTSCEDDINLTGDAEETAVVYGLLNSADSYHYIKINRAFITNDNSLEIAQIPDSNYFEKVDAVITEVDENDVVLRTWNLKDTILTNKEPGVFYNPEQKVYYFQTSTGAPLIANPLITYKLDININDGEFVVSGKTTIVAGMSITSPTASGTFTFSNTNFATQGYSNTNIAFFPGESKVAEVNLKVTYEEHKAASFENKVMTWRVSSLGVDDLNGTKKTVSAKGAVFYELMKESVTNDPAIIQRKLRSIAIEVTGGSEDFQKYIAVTKPSSSLSQTKPSFTNLTATKGRRVVGLFASRNTVRIFISNQDLINGNPKEVITSASRQQLSIGALTGALLFCSDHPFDNTRSYYCD